MTCYEKAELHSPKAIVVFLIFILNKIAETINERPCCSAWISYLILGEWMDFSWLKILREAWFEIHGFLSLFTERCFICGLVLAFFQFWFSIYCAQRLEKEGRGEQLGAMHSRKKMALFPVRNTHDSIWTTCGKDGMLPFDLALVP